MVDVLTKNQRSYCMSRIRWKNTKPEMTLKKALFKAGLRGYRSHYKLTGKPDIIFPKKKIAIFIDGCFWHKCPKCFTTPATNRQFWLKKIQLNIKRDAVVNRELKRNGWAVIRIWEHEINKDTNKALRKIRIFLNS